MTAQAAIYKGLRALPQVLKQPRSGAQAICFDSCQSAEQYWRIKSPKTGDDARKYKV